MKSTHSSFINVMVSLYCNGPQATRILWTLQATIIRLGKFIDKRISSTAAKPPVKFQVHMNICGLQTSPDLKIRCLSFFMFDSRYIAVIYVYDSVQSTAITMIKLQSGLQSQTTPHTSPLRVSYGVSFVSYTAKNDCDISGVHCTEIRPCTEATETGSRREGLP